MRRRLESLKVRHCKEKSRKIVWNIFEILTRAFACSTWTESFRFFKLWRSKMLISKGVNWISALKMLKSEKFTDKEIWVFDSFIEIQTQIWANQGRLFVFTQKRGAKLLKRVSKYSIYHSDYELKNWQCRAFNSNSLEAKFTQNLWD